MPAGAFAMGSPESEEAHDDTEAPLHPVKVGKRFALGKLEVTVGEFAAFAQETGRPMGERCDIWKRRQLGGAARLFMAQSGLPSD